MYFNPFDGSDTPDEFSWMEPDFILTYLVSSLANMAGAPVGITLLIKGTIMTGTLISEREYLSLLSDILQSQVRRALSMLSEQERKIAESAFDLSDLIEDFYPGVPNSDEDDDEDEDLDEMMPGMSPIHHLHLKDPIVISPQPAISFSDGLFPVLRIKLASIDGWMLGSSIPDTMAPPSDGEIRH